MSGKLFTFAIFVSTHELFAGDFPKVFAKVKWMLLILSKKLDSMAAKKLYDRVAFQNSKIQVLKRVDVADVATVLRNIGFRNK